MSSAKRAAYEHLLRFAPNNALNVIHGYADAGDYAAARRSLASFTAISKAMYKKPPPEEAGFAIDAGFAAMAGDAAGARASLDKAKAAFAKDRAAGTVDGATAASIDEEIAFAEAALAQAEGRAADARRLISQRTLWANVSPGMVVDLIQRLIASAPQAERVGILAGDPNRLWVEAQTARVTAINDEKLMKRAWVSLTELVVDRHYAPMARQAATGSNPKPRWLLKPDKSDPLPFDIVSIDGRFYGPAVNEPMMLHAALIAKARGKRGFALLPTRKEMGFFGVKFVNPGDEGIDEAMIVNADRLIADLSPHVTPPPAAGGSN
jgi:hypothetical protein